MRFGTNLKFKSVLVRPSSQKQLGAALPDLLEQWRCNSDHAGADEEEKKSCRLVSWCFCRRTRYGTHGVRPELLHRVSYCHLSTGEYECLKENPLSKIFIKFTAAPADTGVCRSKLLAWLRLRLPQRVWKWTHPIRNCKTKTLIFNLLRHTALKQPRVQLSINELKSWKIYIPRLTYIPIYIYIYFFLLWSTLKRHFSLLTTSWLQPHNEQAYNYHLSLWNKEIKRAKFQKWDCR